MAYNCPYDLDGFLPHLGKADTKFRQTLGQDLLNYLAEPSNSIYCQDIGQLVDGLIPWMQSSNYKVSSNGIEVMTYLADRLSSDFKPYIQSVLPATIDRLGDAKDTVREKAQLLLLKLLERAVLSPQQLLERLSPGLGHKNAKIREEVLRCLVNTLNEHGAQSISLSKFIPGIVKLLSDPTSSVRDTAFSTVVELYKHIGERLRMDLQRKNLVPAARLPVLMQRFDEVKEAGELLFTAVANDRTGSGKNNKTEKNGVCVTTDAREVDELDRIAMPKPIVPVKRALVLSAAKRIPPIQSRTGSALTGSSSVSSLNRLGSIRRTPISTKSDPGAIDEDTFLKSFEDAPTVQIFGNRELNEHMNGIRDIISDTNKDWNKRVDALKKIRSLIIAGAVDYEDFHTQLRNLEIALQTSVKDLRSQVVREACITISYLSQTLNNKFDHTAEFLLSNIINLIQNSAKVMASSGNICVRFLIQHTQYSRFIPIITTNLITHKSKDIRRSCCEFLEVILLQWSAHLLERHLPLILDALKKGISDADPDARVISRRAFRAFKEHFPDHAENLLQSLEPTYRKALQGELCLSSSSSSGSLAQPSIPSSGSSGMRTPRTIMRPPASAHGGSSSVTDSAKRGGFRSNSAIDLQAAQRAKARAQYSAMSRQKITSGTASLPTSRSGSPSSRLSYATYGRVEHHESPRPRRMSSGIPRSTAGSRDTSRETSPTRLGVLPRFGSARSGSTSRPPLSPASRPVMAQRILQQSIEAESALADALTYDSLDSSDFGRINSARKTLRSLDNHSDDSETSSVCSERSFDSYRRPSDDINEIISHCASTTWQERKEGLVSLQHYLNNGNVLSKSELKLITEIFTKMFMDPHTKVLSLFLDTLNELIVKHGADLNDWLYVLLQRIFNKLGTEILSSLYKKIHKTLELIKIYFPCYLQMQCACRFLVDNTQTPNTKVKVSVLTYLRDVAKMAEGSQFFYQPPASQALSKIVSYTQDTKSVEVRNAAKICVIALFNCNTPQMMMLLNELSKAHQEIASQIVHNHLKKSSGSEPGSPVVTGSPKTLSPQTPNHPQGDDITKEEIYKSLRRTTAEIQNYSFEGLALGISKLERDRDTTSQDSGISQMSAGGNENRTDGIVSLEERMEELSLQRANSYITETAPGGPSSPGTRHNSSSGATSLPYNIAETESNGYAIDDVGDSELIRKILELEDDDCEVEELEQRKLLGHLYALIKNKHVQLVIEHFRRLLKILLKLLQSTDSRMQILVLFTLTEIFRSDELRPCYLNFVELLVLKILCIQKEQNKEVVRCAEQCAASMTTCPFDTVVGVLKPLITTSEFPLNQAGIKMMTKLVEQHSNEITDEHLQEIMPILIQAYDHEESPVRKCSVFCMVALHSAVGEDRMAPYFESLVGSKRKLVHLYVKRAQQGSSVPTSPKNSATS